MQKPVGVGLGEVLWDMLPDEHILGGAPANFAYHFQTLGGLGFVVSQVGDDALGREAVALLQKRGLDVSRISVDAVHQTGRVEVVMAADGSASYIFPDEVAWDFIPPVPDDDPLPRRAACVCFGSLCQRSEQSRHAVQNFLLQVAPDTLRVFDCNLRQQFYTREVLYSSLQLADVFKVNDEELLILAPMLGVADAPLTADARREVLSRFVTQFDLGVAALTCGANGSVVMTPDQCFERKGDILDVADTIGAGDSFTAALALGLLCDMPVGLVHEHAAKVAAYVCTKRGAMPRLPDELRLLPR
ncbi:PfkB family carbohydrate kinase [Oleidesulfovibrio sp.]|uniref:PfkB family carbohydrate kinase n=1 Tax=Oleidesulfovibrio sp. TaxID=2909707 RepID=UPI003A89688F